MNIKISERSYFGLQLFGTEVGREALDLFLYQFKLESKARGFKETKVRQDYAALKILTWNQLGQLKKPMNREEVMECFDYQSKNPLPEQINKVISNKYYIIKDEVLEEASKIKIHNMTFDYLKSLETQLSSYLISKDSCLRFQVLKGCYIQGGIFTNDAKTKGEIELGWYLFDIDLIKKKICFNHSVIESFKNIDKEDYHEPFLLFLQLLTFVCLSDLDIHILPPNTKKTYINGISSKVVNTSKSNVIVVGKKWNTISIRLEGFKVCGHYRLQPCGKDRKDIKLIFVDSFMKNGYVKRSNKNLNKNEN